MGVHSDSICLSEEIKQRITVVSVILSTLNKASLILLQEFAKTDNLLLFSFFFAKTEWQMLWQFFLSFETFLCIFYIYIKVQKYIVWK